MLAKRSNNRKKKESGQALVELMMIMPILLTLIWYMIHVNLAINKSIVGQIAARSQLFLKIYNHSGGPVKSEFIDAQRAAFFVGVTGEPILTSSNDPGDGMYPAPVEILGIGANPQKLSIANDDPGEAASGSYRQRVRIRTVFGICTEKKPSPIANYPGNTGDIANFTGFCGKN